MAETLTPPINPFKKTTAAVKRIRLLSVTALLIASVALILAMATWHLHQTLQKQHTLQQQRIQSMTAVTTQPQPTAKPNATRITTTTREPLGTLIQLAALAQSRGNHNAAIQYLDTAKKILSDNKDTQSTKRRDMLTQHIEAIKNSDQHTTQLFNTLNHLQSELAKLSIIPSHFESPAASTTPPTGWRNKIKQLLKTLKPYVVVKQNSTQQTSLLNQQQATLIQQNLSFAIRVAKWGLLHHNTALYLSGLNTIKNQLAQYYFQPQRYQPISQQLNQLIKTPLPTQPTLVQLLLTFQPQTAREKQ